MTTVHIRRQGGAAIVDIPDPLLRRPQADIGTPLSTCRSKGVLTVRSVAAQSRKRYNLKEILRGATPEAMAELQVETAWAHGGYPVGRELA
jgi:antitoxin component of MazEF toxin-antitoxin module